jgi:hypothetical protein
MSILLKDKIKADKSFISDLIAKSWEDSESIQNQINSIEVDSATAEKVVQLLKELLTSYYVFTGCLENLENEPIEVIKPKTVVPEPIVVPETAVKAEIPEYRVSADNVDIDATVTSFNSTYNDEIYTDTTSEPFEYFVDFDDPVGEPLTDDDLYK